MIFPLFLAGSLLIPVNETTWWRSSEGTMIEYKDASGISCVLTLHDAHSNVMFEWDKDRTFVTVRNQQLKIADEARLPVSINIGNAWVNYGGPEPIVPAVGNGNGFSVVITQSVDDLLRSADHIAVVTPDAQIGLKLDPHKIAVLLEHSQQCRKRVQN